jgi:hypothetical protein
MREFANSVLLYWPAAHEWTRGKGKRGICFAKFVFAKIGIVKKEVRGVRGGWAGARLSEGG